MESFSMKSLLYFSLSICTILLTYSVCNFLDRTGHEIAVFRQDTSRYIITLDETTKNLEKEVSTLNNNLSKTTDVLNKTSKNINDVLLETKTTLSIYNQIPEKVETKFAKYFDCDMNGYCYQNLVTDTILDIRDTSKNISSMSNEIAVTSKKVNASTDIILADSKNFVKNTEEITRNFVIVSDTLSTEIPKTTQNVTSITNNIDRLTKPRWYDRLIGYAANGTLIWFNVNRATGR